MFAQQVIFYLRAHVVCSEVYSKGTLQAGDGQLEGGPGPTTIGILLSSCLSVYDQNVSCWVYVQPRDRVQVVRATIPADSP